MKSQEAKFIISSPNLSKCPNFDLPEFALIGRSNVGKSSFINTLSNNKKLAKTSNTPGKTRLINYFDFSGKYMIADLPGYGYAKVSKEMQSTWQRDMEEYLLKRESIASLIHFIDARHEPQKNDMAMSEWIKFNTLNCFIVLTKADHIPRSNVLGAVRKVEKIMGFEVLPFSTASLQYNQPILARLDELSSDY